MATTKNIIMKQFNGTDYDTLYPKTIAAQIDGAVPITSGGTNGTTAPSGVNNLVAGLSQITPASNDLFPFRDISGNTGGSVTLANLVTALGNSGAITSSNLASQASALGFAKIQAGSYVGTGTYGVNNPCSLTFDFIPQFIIFTNVKTTSLTNPFAPSFRDGDAMYNYIMLNAQILTTSYVNGAGFGSETSAGATPSGKKSEDGKTVYWYNGKDPSYQFNTESFTYYWVAFG